MMVDIHKMKSYLTYSFKIVSAYHMPSNPLHRDSLPRDFTKNLKTEFVHLDTHITIIKTFKSYLLCELHLTILISVKICD